jgi:Domain of unknown function (DUF1963)
VRWLKRRQAPVDPGPGEGDMDTLQRLAHTHLGDELAARWLALLRPAVHLAAAGAGDPVVSRLGGLPHLPAEVEWPTWAGHGPLAFIAEIDLAALASVPVDIGLGLPEEGRLLAFYWDGSIDDGVEVIGPWDPDSFAGTRLVHVLSAREADQPHPAPAGLAAYAEVELSGRPELTEPGWEHPVVRRAFGYEGRDHAEWKQHPVMDDAFMDAVVEARPSGARHRIGGWASPVQGPVELEAAEMVGLRSGDGITDDEAVRWDLLLQVDSDDAAGVMWGDVGTLYWLTRDGRRPGDALATTSFTWQCS